MVFQAKTMGGRGAHAIADKDHAGEPMAIIGMLYGILWLYVYGILRNSLNFVLTVFSICFRYFSFQMEELGTIAGNTPHVFRIL